MITPPRPTMTPEDQAKLREFFDSPAGRRMIGEMNRAFDVPPLTERRGENFWRDHATGQPLDMEATSMDPLDPSRPFPAPRPPKEVARLVSLRTVNIVILAIIIIALSFIACASIMAWFIFDALRAGQ